MSKKIVVITGSPRKKGNNFAREFDTFPNEKQRISRMNAYIFLSNLLFLYIGFFGFLRYNGIEVKKIEGQYIKIKKC